MAEPSKPPELEVSLLDTKNGNKFQYDVYRPSIGETYVVTLEDDIVAVESVKSHQGKSTYTPVGWAPIPTGYSVNFDMPHHEHSKTIHDTGAFRLSRNSRGVLSGMRLREGASRQVSHLSSTIPEPVEEETEEGGSTRGVTQVKS
jgi:hypothetical protein